MSDYKRKTERYIDEDGKNCVRKLAWDGEILHTLAKLEDKIENSHKVEIYYKPPFETKYAIIKYYARQGKPLKVAEYYVYGEELKTGKQLIGWEYLSSTNFSVIEDDFTIKAEAEAKLAELKRKVC